MVNTVYLTESRITQEINLWACLWGSFKIGLIKVGMTYSSVSWARGIDWIKGQLSKRIHNALFPDCGQSEQSLYTPATMAQQEKAHATKIIWVWSPGPRWWKKNHSPLRCLQTPARAQWPTHKLKKQTKQNLRWLCGLRAKSARGEGPNSVPSTLVQLFATPLIPAQPVGQNYPSKVPFIGVFLSQQEK